MKERPILFSGPMVRALLDGSKTQTRRICKQQPYSNGFMFDGCEILCHNDYLPPSAMLMDYRDGGETYTTSNMEGWDFCCPYGQPGDRLWVRETYRLRRESLNGAPMDGVAPNLFCDSTRWFEADGAAPELFGKLRPSIHMPRWASRILLEIVSVRVERLQDISQDDARAEGIMDGGCVNCGKPERSCNCDFPMPDYRDSFFHLWGQINGPDSWVANPWVWVVEFKRIAAPHPTVTGEKEGGQQ